MLLCDYCVSGKKQPQNATVKLPTITTQNSQVVALPTQTNLIPQGFNPGAVKQNLLTPDNILKPTQDSMK